MTVAAVIVSWDDAPSTAAAVDSLLAQTSPLAEVVVVDNHPDQPTLAIPGLAERARIIASPENLGFAGGAALGIRETTADWVLLLNPDAVAAPTCLERLLEAAGERTGVVGAQLLLPDGRANAGDNPVHLTGITWAGHYGEPAETTPPRAVASVSGGAMLVRRSAYDAIGGMNERYFLYHEDVELSWRMRLAGWDVVFQPAAHVTHDYSFDKGTRKWFLLERNRAWTVLTCYSGRALLLLAPLLLATELAVSVQARRGGWWPEKREAWRAVWRERHEVRERRAAVQRSRTVGDREIVELLRARIETPFLPEGPLDAAGPALDVYRRAVLLGLPRGAQ